MVVASFPLMVKDGREETLPSVVSSSMQEVNPSDNNIAKAHVVRICLLFIVIIVCLSYTR